MPMSGRRIAPSGSDSREAGQGMGVRRGVFASVVAATCGIGLAAAAGLSWGATETTTLTYGVTGATETFTVPSGVTTLHVVAVGGRGGLAAHGDDPGGAGARIEGDLAVTPGQVLYVTVGANGAPGTGSLGGPGAFGGGGAGGAGGGNASGGGGGSGGGASSLASAPSNPTARFLI